MPNLPSLLFFWNKIPKYLALAYSKKNLWDPTKISLSLSTSLGSPNNQSQKKKVQFIDFIHFCKAYLPIHGRQWVMLFSIYFVPTFLYAHLTSIFFKCVKIYLYFEKITFKKIVYIKLKASKKSKRKTDTHTWLIPRQKVQFIHFCKAYLPIHSRQWVMLFSIYFVPTLLYAHLTSKFFFF